jgi:hypothetical protein
MGALAVDRLSSAELRALDAVEQGNVLNDLFNELKRLADLKVIAIDGVADARIRAISAGIPASRSPEVIDARRKQDKITAAIAARKEQIKILQTLIRAVPS